MVEDYRTNANGNRPIPVLVADDHPVIRSGLRYILAEAPDMVVAAEGADAQQTLAAVRSIERGVLLLDLSMPGSEGLELLTQVHRERPDVPVLVLTVSPEEQFAVCALRAGASGYLVKGTAAADLVCAIRSVWAGGRYVSASLAERLARDLTRGTARPHDLVSDREYQIFRRLAAGQSTRVISEDLALSIKTIATYRARVFQKLGMRSNAELAAYAVRNHLAD
jgi:DNA-binding NarL/FixJ family response regulator